MNLRLITFLAVFVISLLGMTTNAIAADWIVSYPFANGDSFFSGMSRSDNNAGAMTPCVPTNGSCSLYPNMPRVQVSQTAKLTETVGEGFFVQAPQGAKVSDLYITIKYQIANNGRLSIGAVASAGATQPALLFTGSNSVQTKTIHFSGSFDNATVYMGRKGTDASPVGAGNINVFAITNVDVRFSEVALPQIFEDARIASDTFITGNLCSTLHATNQANGIGSVGLAYYNNAGAFVGDLSNIPAQGTGNRYIPGYGTWGPAQACLSTAGMPDGPNKISSWVASAIGTRTYGSQYTILVDNKAPVVSEANAPTDLLRPFFSIKYNDGAGSGVQTTSTFYLDGVDISKPSNNWSSSLSSSQFSFAWNSGTNIPAMTPGAHTVSWKIVDKIGFSTTGSYSFKTPPLPVNTSAPTVTGNPQAGQTLTCNPGVWTNATKYTYTWIIAGNRSGYSTITTLMLDNYHVDKSVACSVTAEGPGGKLVLDSAAVVVKKASTATTTKPSTGGTATGSGSNATSGACTGVVAQATYKKTMRVGAKNKSTLISKVRQGKCVSFTIKVKVGKKFVPLNRGTVKLETGTSKVVGRTNTRGVVHMTAKGTTNSKAKLSFAGGKVVINY